MIVTGLFYNRLKILWGKNRSQKDDATFPFPPPDSEKNIQTKHECHTCSPSGRESLNMGETVGNGGRMVLGRRGLHHISKRFLCLC